MEKGRQRPHLNRRARLAISHIFWELIDQNGQTLHEIAGNSRVGYMTFHRMLYAKTLDPTTHSLGRMLRTLNASKKQSIDVLWWAAFGHDRSEK